MSCDIHQKVFINGEEVNWKELIGQNYDIFAVIAGIPRGDLRFENTARNDGFPPEISEEWIQNEFNNGNCNHSPVWYTPKELKRAMEKTVRKVKKYVEKIEKKYPGFMEGDGEEYMDNIHYMESIANSMSEFDKHKKDDVKIFFYFDN